MLLLAAAAAAATGAVPPPEAARAPVVAVPAKATVRIVAGVRLKLDSETNENAPRAHDGIVRADGKDQPARLIEFE